MKDIKGDDTPFLRSGTPNDKQQAPERQEMKTLLFFSSPQRPDAWISEDVGTIIFANASDAQRAEALFTRMQATFEARSKELESALRDLGALYSEVAGQWPSSYVHKHSKVIKYLRETGE